MGAGQPGGLAVFADELRAARTAAGLSQDQLAGKIAYSSSLVSMIEACRRVPTLDFARRCDEALAAGGTLVRLQPVAASEVFPSWFRQWADLEGLAVSLRSWEPVLVPGLLQTEEYARAVIRAGREGDDEAKLEEEVAARMRRQAILDGDTPPFCWFVIDEAVLRRPVGAPAAFAEQLGRLLEAAQRPRVKLQVVPFGAGVHAGMTGPFVVASFSGEPDVVLMEAAWTGLTAPGGETVVKCAFCFDSLRADALSPSQTVDLLRGEVEQWQN